MTSASVPLSFFRLLTASRSPNSRNTRKHSREKPKPAVSLPVPPVFHSAGCEATSYTRLPPKDDFKLHPSLGLSGVSDVIRIREAPVPAVDSRSKNLSKTADYAEDDWDEEGGAEQFLGLDSGDDEVIFGSESDDDGMDLDLEGEFDGEVELEEGDVKEKGVPAVMRCFDRAKIYVNAGDGGNGAVAFRREKFVPYGGPSGGDGGKGGNVYVEVDGSMNSLLPFRKNLHFRAGRGGHGLGKNQSGAKGEDVVVKVAPGTVIRESGKGGVEGAVLLELLKPGQRALLLPGGRGGRGNASFKSGTRKVPKIAENGEAGAEMWLDLELKLVADIGIVGAPNAGKSTLLSAITAAQPSIANYPFTTLLPNLGVVSLDYDETMVVADLPGLLEGAHRGFGLGHEFLRHTERCAVLGCGPRNTRFRLFSASCHRNPPENSRFSTDFLLPAFNRMLDGDAEFALWLIRGVKLALNCFECLSTLCNVERNYYWCMFVDGSSQQPEYEFDAVRLELELFSPELSEKLYIVAFNKMDLPEAYEKWDSFRKYVQNRRIEPLCISAMHRQGTHDVISAAHSLLQKELAKRTMEDATFSENLNHVADAIEKQRSASMREFEIIHESSSNTWHVVGAGIERFAQMTNWRYNESLRRFQHALEACGVYKALLKDGVKEGDTVIVGEMEMIWNSENEQPGASGIKKGFSGTVKWQQLG